jgi:hypothetical protein
MRMFTKFVIVLMLTSTSLAFADEGRSQDFPNGNFKVWFVNGKETDWESLVKFLYEALPDGMYIYAYTDNYVDNAYPYASVLVSPGESDVSVFRRKGTLNLAILNAVQNYVWTTEKIGGKTMVESTGATFLGQYRNLTGKAEKSTIFNTLLKDWLPKVQ